MGSDGCHNESLEEKLMCAQAALQRAQDERDSARQVAIEALRLLTPSQYTQLRETLGDLDLEALSRADV